MSNTIHGGSIMCLASRARAARAALLALLALLFAPAAGALVPAAAGAQGRLIVRPCAPADRGGVRAPCPPRIDPIRRASSDVRVTLADRVLRYEVTETFVNDGRVPGEADYVFPLPTGAAFQELQLQVGNEMVSGEVLDADEARRVYEEIVRSQRDPALVEWMGRGLLRTRIFPIAPGERKRVVVRYAVVAPREGDALRVDHDAGGATLTLRIPRQAAVGAPYSPTSRLDVRDAGDGWREVAVRDSATGPVTILLPVRRGREAAIGVVAHRPRAGEDGFVLVTVTPPEMRAAATPRDVVFVVDVSGSMRGPKMEQARAAGRQLLATLDPGDRFRIIAFASDVRPFREGWSEVSPASLGSARRFLDGLDAAGSTNISGALEAALDVPSMRGRLPLVLFLTDGEPTVGERDPDAIARRAEELRGSARIFTFGVGHDVNVALLEQLAMDGGGTAQFVRPEEDVERAVSIVASRLTRPLVTGVRVAMDGARLVHQHPAGELDLFAGQDLVILARYEGSGPATVRVTGAGASGPVRWSTRVDLPERERESSFVARLWATQRVGWLSAERRRRGASPELDAEIRSLGMRYGIPTELSSYLVIEPGAGPGRMPPIVPRVGQGGMAPAPVVMGAAGGSGTAGGVRRAESEFAAARTASELRAAVTLADAVMAVPRAADAEAAREAGGRRFLLRDGVWTDVMHVEGREVVRVRAFGAGYFRLLELIPELAEPFALGERVLVAGRGLSVEVSPDAPESLDAATLARAREVW